MIEPRTILLVAGVSGLLAFFFLVNPGPARDHVRESRPLRVQSAVSLPLALRLLRRGLLRGRLLGCDLWLRRFDGGFLRRRLLRYRL